MEPNDITALVKAIELSGPYGLAAFLWLQNVRVNRDLSRLHEQIVELATKQTEAIVKVENALVALKDAITEWRQ